MPVFGLLKTTPSGGGEGEAGNMLPGELNPVQGQRKDRSELEIVSLTGSFLVLSVRATHVFLVLPVSDVPSTYLTPTQSL